MEFLTPEAHPPSLSLRIMGESRYLSSSANIFVFIDLSLITMGNRSFFHAMIGVKINNYCQTFFICKLFSHTLVSLIAIGLRVLIFQIFPKATLLLDRLRLLFFQI